MCTSLPVLYNAEDTFKTSPKLDFSTDCTTSPAVRESSAFLLGRSVTASMDLLSPIEHPSPLLEVSADDTNLRVILGDCERWRVWELTCQTDDDSATKKASGARRCLIITGPFPIHTVSWKAAFQTPQPHPLTTSPKKATTEFPCRLYCTPIRVAATFLQRLLARFYFHGIGGLVSSLRNKNSERGFSHSPVTSTHHSWPHARAHYASKPTQLCRRPCPNHIFL